MASYTEAGANRVWSIADNALHDVGGALTVGVWFKTATDQNALTAALVCHDLSEYKYMFYCENTAGQFGFYVRVGGTVYYSRHTGFNEADGAWHLFVGTFDRTLGSARVKFYVDGVVRNTDNAKDADIDAGDQGITNHWIDTTRNFRGTTCEVAIWNVDIGANAIARWWGAGSPVTSVPLMLSATKPVVYCPMIDGDGGANYGQDTTALALAGGAVSVPHSVRWPVGASVVTWDEVGPPASSRRRRLLCGGST